MCVTIGYVIRVYMAGCHATRLLYFSIIVFRYLESTYVTHYFSGYDPIDLNIFQSLILMRFQP